MADRLFKIRILRAFLEEAFTSWRDQLWDRDLDEPYCCDGRECCCGGETVRSIFTSCSPKDQTNEPE